MKGNKQTLEFKQVTQKQLAIHINAIVPWLTTCKWQIKSVNVLNLKFTWPCNFYYYPCIWYNCDVFLPLFSFIKVVKLKRIYLFIHSFNAATRTCRWDVDYCIVLQMKISALMCGFQPSHVDLDTDFKYLYLILPLAFIHVNVQFECRSLQ